VRLGVACAPPCTFQTKTRQIETLIGELVASDFGAEAWLSALGAIRIQGLLVKLGCAVVMILNLCSA
jgi:hypothetical protein